MTDVKKALGAAIKSARTALEITQDQLAERLGISTRYIMLLENAHKTPSFNLLTRIIRELNIQPDSVFYPEKPSKDSQVDDLIRLLYNCDERSMKIIRATVKASIDSQS